MRRAIVLNSGGCDSTTCVGLAVERLGAENVVTASVSYGQRHAKELDCARDVAEHYGVEHIVVDLTGTGVFTGTSCPLIEGAGSEIPHKSYVQQIEENGKGMVQTYVPFRNGLILSCMASVAMSRFLGDEVDIYIGAHADDAAGEAYADCSMEFVEAMDKAISIGTYGKVHVVAPFAGVNKAGVVAEGLRLGVPYELTWSCYEGGDVQCGTCGTCIDRKAAFAANGAVDPVPYMA